MNLSGSLFWLRLSSACEVSFLSPSFPEGESAGFFEGESFSIGLKNRFMAVLCFLNRVILRRSAVVFCGR